MNSNFVEGNKMSFTAKSTTIKVEWIYETRERDRQTNGEGEIWDRKLAHQILNWDRMFNIFFLKKTNHNISIEK